MLTLADARRLYRMLPLQLRARLGLFLGPILSALARRLRPIVIDAPSSNNSVSIAGLFSAPHGVGVAARLCVAELEAAGIAVRAVDLTAALDVSSEASFAHAITREAHDDEAIVLHFNPSSLLQALVTLDRSDLDRRRIGYWVWELEAVPTSWRAAAQHVHEIWAPSHFCADAFRHAFEHDVKVVPHPAALAPPRLRQEMRSRLRARFDLDDDGFLVLSSFAMNSCMARKNPLAAVRAFKDAFGQAAKTRLVLRCRGAGSFPAGIAALRQAVREAGEHVILVDDDGSLQSLNDMYAACDAYLSLHRSEGFGLNLAEAMLCEKPVIATAWSGNLDFMTEDAAALVPCALTPVKDPQRIYTTHGARWAEPDHDAAVEWLRVLARDRDRLAALGRAGAALAHARLSGGAAAAALRRA